MGVKNFEIQKNRRSRKTLVQNCQIQLLKLPQPQKWLRNFSGRLLCKNPEYKPWAYRPGLIDIFKQILGGLYSRRSYIWGLMF